MSQVKKLETGGTTPNSTSTDTPKLKFKINGKDYEQDQQSFQDTFNPAFDDLVAKGAAKERNRADYFKTFQQLNQQAKNGLYNINSSNGKYLNSTYQGPDGANLGLDDKGNNAHKSVVGNIISPFSRDDHQRMAILNTAIGDRLIQHHDADGLAAKTKADAELEKQNLAKTNSQNELISQYNDYQAPGTAIYGRTDGADDKWANEKFWGDKNTHGQTGILANTFGKMGSYLFDSRFDDKDTQDAFYNANKVHIEDLRKKFTDRGFANGKFNQPMDINGIVGLADDLELRRKYENYFNRPVAPVAGGTGALTTTTSNGAGGAKTTTVSNGSVNQTTTIAPHWKFEGNKLYSNGKLYDGTYINDTGLDSDFTDTQAGHYWHGEKTDYNTLFHNATTSGNGELVKSIQSINDKITERRNKSFDALEDVNGIGENKFNPNNVSDTFVFKDQMDKTGKIPKSREISTQFPKIRADEGARLFSYKVDGKDGLGYEGRVKQRYVTANGKIVDGRIRKGNDGKYELISDDGKVSIQLGDMQSGGAERTDPYNRVGTYQLGGVVGKSSNTGFKSADVNNIIPGRVGNIGNLSTADKVQLGAIGADLGGLVAGFVPGGSVVAAGLGVGSTAAQLSSDYMKHGFKLGDYGSAAINLGLDAATLIPGAGEFAKFAKIGNGIKKSASVVRAALIGAGALGAVKSLGKLLGDEHMTIDDWTSIAGGLQAAAAGKRALDGRIATKNVDEHTISIGGKQVPLTAAQATEIRSAKPGEQKGIAEKLLTDQLVDGQTVDTENQTVKGFLNSKTMGLLGKSANKDYQVPQLATTTSKQLIDYNKANWLQRSAINNTVAQNPNIKGSENFIINKSDGAIRADQNTPSTVGWLRDSYKMQHSPLTMKELPASSGKSDFTGKWSANSQPGKAIDVQEVDGRTGMSSLIPPYKQPALPPSSGKTEGVNYVTPTPDTKSPDKMGPLATSGKSQTSIANLGDQENIKSILDKVNLINEKGGSSTSAVNNKYHADELRSALNIKKGQSIKPKDVQKLFGGDLFGGNLSPEQTSTRDRFMRTSFGKGSYGERLQNSIKSVLQGTNSGRKGVKFKEGGSMSVLKAQGGTSMWRNPLDVNKLYKAVHTFDQFMPKPMLEATTPKFSVLNTPTTIDANANELLPNDPGSSRVEATKGGLDLSGVGRFLKGIDPTTVSEFARAMYTRNLNSQIDTKVERPMLEAPIEQSVPVRGNLFATAVANKKANDVLEAAGRLNTSDSSIQAASFLDANDRAAQLRMQGDAQNIQELQRTQGMADQNAQRNAEMRTNVANQNIQTNARATQAERAAENDKFGRMNQPLMDFWKDQNYRSQAESAQNKQYDTEIALQGKQSEFNNVMQPMRLQLDKLQQQQSILDNKRFNGGLKTEEETQYQNIAAQISKLSNDAQIKQQRANILYLNTRKNLNYQTPSDFWNTVVTKKEGGTVQAKALDVASKERIQESKENAQNAIFVAKQQRESIKDDSDQQAKKDLQAAAEVASLIKMALS